ncbi:hypothetical protein [Pontibacillus halophilus]|uniref:hypothetical protein n=1 Tax=Pontibacillus halophilus TaxID=516704 RepID=UPI000420CDE5|nr:hypothetical protein [Pontibacillus halophilus]
MNEEKDYPHEEKSRRKDEETYTSQSKIHSSGNSQVDLHISIDIDVKPIAFAMLYSLLAMKEVTAEEFEEAIKRMQEL